MESPLLRTQVESLALATFALLKGISHVHLIGKRSFSLASVCIAEISKEHATLTLGTQSTRLHMLLCDSIIV